MSDPSITIVESYRFTGDDIDLSGTDFWGLALDQRAFGPRQTVVVTARRDGTGLGLAHCERTEPPELALKCCLAELGPGAAAVAYSDEPVPTDPPADLRDRLDTARETAKEFGVHLVDWVMCDDLQMRSMRLALEHDGRWWVTPDGGFPSPTPPPRANSRNRSSLRPKRRRREPGSR